MVQLRRLAMALCHSLRGRLRGRGVGDCILITELADSEFAMSARLTQILPRVKSKQYPIVESAYKRATLERSQNCDLYQVLNRF
jgi:hypothetical protein